MNNRFRKFVGIEFIRDIINWCLIYIRKKNDIVSQDIYFDTREDMVKSNSQNISNAECINN